MRDREPLFCKFDLHNAMENHGRKLRELSEQVSLVTPKSS